MGDTAQAVRWAPSNGARKPLVQGLRAIPVDQDKPQRRSNQREQGYVCRQQLPQIGKLDPIYPGLRAEPDPGCQPGQVKHSSAGPHRHRGIRHRGCPQLLRVLGGILLRSLLRRTGLLQELGKLIAQILARQTERDGGLKEPGL